MKYLIKQNGLYATIEGAAVTFSSIITKSTKFDTEEEALLAAKNSIDDSRESYEIISLTAKEYFNLISM